MAQVEIEWLQRVNGRTPGQREVVEHTPYIDALIRQRRAAIIHKPIVAVFRDQPIAVLDLPSSFAESNDEPETFTVSDVLDEDAGALAAWEAMLLEEDVVEIPVAPKPKPRAPRKPKPAEESTPAGDSAAE